MSDTAELAVHLAAAAQGADAAQLCDSAAFMSRVEALRPDTVGYVQRVAEAVQEAVATEPAYRLAAQHPAAPAGAQDGGEQAPGAPMSRSELLAREATRRAQLTRDYSGEITSEDLQLAEPSIVAAWATSGKLAHLGVPQQKARRWRR